jgi:hypothetical protein
MLFSVYDMNQNHWSGDLAEWTGLPLLKVAYSRCDIPSPICQTGNTLQALYEQLLLLSRFIWWCAQTSYHIFWNVTQNSQGVQRNFDNQILKPKAGDKHATMWDNLAAMVWKEKWDMHIFFYLADSFGTLVPIYQTTWDHIPEEYVPSCLIAWNIMSSIIQDIMKRSPLKLNRHYKLCLLPASCWFPTWLSLQPCGWRWHVTPKSWLTFNGLHTVISQKTELFIASTENVKSYRMEYTIFSTA